MYVPMNIEVRDPLWPMRDMLNFTFSVKPGEAHTLWLDTRDRILPNDKSLLITIASASAEFNAGSLEGAEVRLIFKPYKDALPEHIADRLTQVRDNFSNMTEEHVNSRRLNAYNRFYADITDLLRVDPAERSRPQILARMEPGDGRSGLHAADGAGRCAGVGLSPDEGR